MGIYNRRPAAVGAALASVALIMGTTACSSDDNKSSATGGAGNSAASAQNQQSAAPSTSEVPFQNEPVSMDKVNESNEKYACQKLLGNADNVKKLLASSETKFGDQHFQDWTGDVQSGNGSLIGESSYYAQGQQNAVGYSTLNCTMHPSSIGDGGLTYTVWKKIGNTIFTPGSEKDSNGRWLGPGQYSLQTKQINSDTWLSVQDTDYDNIQVTRSDASADFIKQLKTRNAEIMRRDKALFDYALQNVK